MGPILVAFFRNDPNIVDNVKKYQARFNDDTAHIVHEKRGQKNDQKEGENGARQSIHTRTIVKKPCPSHMKTESRVTACPAVIVPIDA